MSDDSVKIIRTKGAIKLLAGIIMLPLSFIVVFIGFLIRMIGVLGLIAGAITKVTSVYASNEENKIFWPKKPYASWVKHIQTASWKSPIGDAPALTEEQISQNTANINIWTYIWNEENQSWNLVDYKVY